MSDYFDTGDEPYYFDSDDESYEGYGPDPDSDSDDASMKSTAPSRTQMTSPMKTIALNQNPAPIPTTKQVSTQIPNAAHTTQA